MPAKSIASHDPMAAFKEATSIARKHAVADDPTGWASLALPHITFWSKQLEIMEAVEQHSRIAVRACHDSSKSFTASVIAARWLDTHPVGSARVITTAPTATQVRGILWVEINQLHNHPKTNFPGRVNQTEWWIGSYLAGLGRKPADYNPAAFQGLHARYPLIIIDEAAGVPSQIIDAVETLATNINAKILMIGNPDDPTSMFADIHRNPVKYGYHTIKISAWDTPNFTGEPVTELLSEVLLSKEWVEQRRLAWGVDHPFWLSKIEAEFPSIDIQSTIKLADVIAARIPFSERLTTPQNPIDPSDVDAESLTAMHATSTATTNVLPGIATVVLGVDVAGSDQGDETIVRQISIEPLTSKARVLGEWRTRSGDPEQVAEFITNQIILTRPDKVNIDSIGIGFGIIGLVRSLLREYLVKNKQFKMPTVEGFNASNKSQQSEVYGNQRAEVWWEARILFQKGMIDTSNAENRDILEGQLITPRYLINKGKIYVEAKGEVKQRLTRSPDNADAFMYAIWEAINHNVIAISAPPTQSIVNQNLAVLSQRNNPSARAARIPTRRSA
jgi:hypothetical protein